MREASRELIRRRRWGNRKKAASFIISPAKGHDLQYAHTMQNINGHYLSFWRAFTPFVISMAIHIPRERERDSDCVKVEVYVWVALEKYYLKTSHSKLYGAVWDGAHIIALSNSHTTTRRTWYNTAHACQQVPHDAGPVKVVGKLFAPHCIVILHNARPFPSIAENALRLACLHICTVWCFRMSIAQVDNPNKNKSDDVIFLIWGRRPYS